MCFHLIFLVLSLAQPAFNPVTIFPASSTQQFFNRLTGFCIKRQCWDWGKRKSREIVLEGITKVKETKMVTDQVDVDMETMTNLFIKIRLTETKVIYHRIYQPHTSLISMAVRTPLTQTEN